MLNNYKYKIGDTIEGDVEIRLSDPKTNKHRYINKTVKGIITNSTPLLVCGKIENWYTVLCKYDEVFNVCEKDIK